MEHQVLADLQRPDDMSLAFVPGSLLVGGHADPEELCRVQGEILADLDLDAVVQGPTRHAFERLQETYRYGLLCYDLYSVVESQARLLLELALGERFVQSFDGRIPIACEQQTAMIEADRFGAVTDAFRRGGEYSKGTWHLVGPKGDRSPRFTGSLTDLVEWAWRDGHLFGRANRARALHFIWFRNTVAHPDTSFTIGPPDALRTLGWLSDTINTLNGAGHEEGGHYPRCVHRHPYAVGWSAGRTVKMRADRLRHAEPDQRDMQFAVLQLADDHEGPTSFDARHESTRHPSDYLWGPGSWQDGVRWLEVNETPDDRVPTLDRWFVIRDRTTRPIRAMRPEVVEALGAGVQRGRWHLVQADAPADAIAHAAHLGAQVGECPTWEGLSTCRVRHGTTGGWAEIKILLEDLMGAPLVPQTSPDFRLTPF